MSLARLVRGLTRWWWQASLAWVVATSAVVAAIQLGLKPLYEASSLLRVEPNAQEIFGNNASSANGSQNYLDTQVQLITSSNVLMAAAADPKATNLGEIRAAADPEVVLRERLEVVILPKSFLIRVSSTSKSPGEAADVVNAVVDSYLAADSEWSESMTRNQIKNMEAYRKGLQAQVEEKQKAWLELAARGNAAAPSATPEGASDRDPASLATKVSVTLDEYKRVRTQVMQAQIELAEAEAVRGFRNGQAAPAAAGGPAGDIERQVVAAFRLDPAVVDIQADIDRLDDQMAGMDRLSRNRNDPATRSLERKLETLLARHDELWRLKYPQIRDRLARAPVPSRDVAEDATERVLKLRANLATLQKSLAQLDVADREQSTDAVKSVRVQSDLRHLDELQALVDRRLEQLRFESRGLARVRRLSEARMPAPADLGQAAEAAGRGPRWGCSRMIVGLTMLMPRCKAGRVGEARSDLSRTVGPRGLRHPAAARPTAPPGAWRGRARWSTSSRNMYIGSITSARPSAGASSPARRGGAW